MKRLFSVTLFFVLSLSLMLGASVSAQDQSSDIALTLSRTPCFGTCPVYTVTVYTDGTVVYEGTDFVTVTGTQTTNIDPETVQELVNGFQNAGYFDWNDEYTHMDVTDSPYVMTSVTVDGNTKEINHYHGDTSAPLALSYLENWVDQMLYTAQWTGVTPPTAAYGFTSAPVITLERGACFGFCPIYNIVIYADGTVVYVGLQNVDVTGVQVSSVETSMVEFLAQQMEYSGYFNWQDEYTTQLITDQVTVTTSLNWNDQYKQIVRYDGDPNAPIGLFRIENRIDELVNSAQWVGDGQ